MGQANPKQPKPDPQQQPLQKPRQRPPASPPQREQDPQQQPLQKPQQRPQRTTEHRGFIQPLCQCTTCGILLVVSFWATLSRLRTQLPQAEAWDEAWMWKQTECSVLHKGVACITGMDHPGSIACSGHQSSWLSAPKEVNAVCPGRYWCGEEGELCNCTGLVTYATNLFNGFQYTYDTSQLREFSVTARGSVVCGNDTAGHKLPDPEFGAKKSCWWQWTCPGS